MSINYKDQREENTPFEFIENASELNKEFDDLESNVLLARIKDFRALDIQNVSQQELSALLDDIVQGNIIPRTDILAGANIYRARVWHYDGKDQSVFYKNASEIWYPKPKFLKKLGRVNNIGQPMLYTSFDALTPIHEIRSQEDTQFALIKYVVKLNQSLKLAEIATKTFPELMNQIPKEGIWKKNGMRNWRIIHNFLEEEFKRRVPEGEEYKYRTTIEIAKKYDYPNCDGFIYPSIEGGVSHNIAIKPQAADRSLDFAGLGYLINKSYDRSTRRIRARDFGTWQRWATFIDNGKIIYAPDGPCRIHFPPMGKPIEKEIEYLVPKK